jgi:hypothetical protein
VRQRAAAPPSSPGLPPTHTRCIDAEQKATKVTKARTEWARAAPSAPAFQPRTGRVPIFKLVGKGPRCGFSFFPLRQTNISPPRNPLTASPIASYIRLFVGLITTAEAAALLKITPVRVRQYINSGRLASEKRRGDHMLDQAEVERFNRQGRRPAGRPTKPSCFARGGLGEPVARARTHTDAHGRSWGEARELGDG